MYSFGRDKVVSCGTGGLVVINKNVKNNFAELYSTLPNMSWWRVAQQLYYMYVVVMIIRPLYHWQIGKAVLAISQKLRLINTVFTNEERVGSVNLIRPQKLSNKLKKILTLQFKYLEKTRQHRQTLQKIYNSEYNQPLIRLPLKIENPVKVQKNTRKQGFLLGTWYRKMFIPQDDIIEFLQLDLQQYPNTNSVIESEIINLPTNINCSIKDAKKLIDIIY